MRTFRLAAILTTLALLLGALLPPAASAHERRTVAGKYQFVVGFLTEPAFNNETNGLDLRVTIPGENNKPVEGLEKTLKATVIVGGGARTMPLTLQTRFGQPGAYAAYFVPTRVGSYIFHITGTLEGTPIDERFESGPGRFNDVQSTEPLQFPDKVGDPATMARDLQAARDDLATTRLLAIGGLALGVLGTLAGIAGVLRRPAPAGAPGGPARR